MSPTLKKILIGLGALVGLTAAGVGGYVCMQVSAFDSSMDQVYDIPIPKVELSTDPEVLARGEHLARSLSGCAIADCHGPNLAGGKPTEVGPLGTLTAPNITKGGMGAAYSDGELLRLLQHGVKKDGRSVRFMPVHEVNWIPDEDLVAIISYLRGLPDVAKPNGPLRIGWLGKVMDRRDAIVFDVARRIDHSAIEKAPAPSATAQYGKHIAKVCMGCHGTTFSGGPIPGAPPDLPTPTNITPDATGIKDWTYADFTKLLDQGVKKNGEKLNPFMPLEALTNMDDTERNALWAFLRTLPAKPFGGR
jgi:mono/diheme cytochrome c family protein